MSARKTVNHQDPLHQLLEVADAKTLIELIEDLAGMRPEVRRECFEFLKAHVKLSPSQQETSEDEAIFALWDELEPELEELDEYGGGDYRLADNVAGLLSEITDKLDSKKASADFRTDLLNNVLPYIRSANAGLDDSLYDVAYACCYNNNDLRQLAGYFAEMGRDWPIDNARGIYRKIGDHEKYLALRFLKMEFGVDYHDLATFYWEQGEPEKALQTAKTGIAKGRGRMDELRQFLSERAQESGDRQGYLSLQFEQTVDYLTLNKYQEFQKLCTQEEWDVYEDAVLKALGQAARHDKLKIHMYRQEFEQALAILLKARYPFESYGNAYELEVAAILEDRFPEKILGYYLSGIGTLNSNFPRKDYAAKAKVMKKVRHVYVDVLNTPEPWIKFARQVKLDNKKRPAFQEEMRMAVAGWDTI
jgi:hypothetical protein